MTGSRWERSRARLQARADGSALDTALFPTKAATGAGVDIRLRIVANRKAAAGINPGNDLQARAGASHTGHLPPGVTLVPGEILSAEDGTEYQVVHPIEHDSLGDTVGLSWRGTDGLPGTGGAGW